MPEIAGLGVKHLIMTPLETVKRFKNKLTSVATIKYVTYLELRLFRFIVSFVWRGSIFVEKKINQLMVKNGIVATST